MEVAVKETKLRRHRGKASSKIANSMYRDPFDPNQRAPFSKEITVALADDKLEKTADETQRLRTANQTRAVDD